MKWRKHSIGMSYEKDGKGTQNAAGSIYIKY